MTKTAEEPIVVSQKTLARILRLTTRQVHNLTESGTLVSKPASNGRDREFVLEEVVPAYVAFKVKSVQTSAQDDRAEQAKIRKLEADAHMSELEVRKLAGELMTVDQHTSRMGALLDRLRSRLSAAPGSWAPQLVGLKTVPLALSKIRDLVNELLTAMNAAADDIVPQEEADAGRPAA